MPIYDFFPPADYDAVHCNKRVKVSTSSFMIYDEYVWGKRVSPDFKEELREKSFELTVRLDVAAFKSGVDFNSYHPNGHPSHVNLDDPHITIMFYLNAIQARHQYEIHNDIPRWYDNDSEGQSPEMLYYSNKMWFDHSDWSKMIKEKYPDLCACVWNGFGLESCPDDLFFVRHRHHLRARRDPMLEPIEFPPRLPEKPKQVPTRVPLQELTSQGFRKSPQTLRLEQETRRYQRELEAQTDRIRINLIQEAEDRDLSSQTILHLRGGRMALPRDADNDPRQIRAQFQRENFGERRDFDDDDMAVQSQLEFETERLRPAVRRPAVRWVTADLDDAYDSSDEDEDSGGNDRSSDNEDKDSDNEDPNSEDDDADEEYSDSKDVDSEDANSEDNDADDEESDSDDSDSENSDSENLREREVRIRGGGP